MPLANSGVPSLGAVSPFARRADPLLAFLSRLSGVAIGRALLPIVDQQQKVLQSSIRLGPAPESPAPSALRRFRDVSADLSAEGVALATIANTIDQAQYPAENDLLAARQATARVVRTSNELFNFVNEAPLILKTELADSLEATATALQSDLSSIGITINADGTLSLNETTLATALDLGSSTVDSAATTLRELGSRLGTLGTQFSQSPAVQLLYQPELNLTSERASARPEAPPPVTLSGAEVVYAYLVSSQRIRMFDAVSLAGSSGTLFSATA